METERLSKLKQKAQHGRPTFPFAIYQSCVPQYGRGYREHYHNEIEVVFMHKGRCDYFIDGEEIMLESCNLLLIPPNVSHSYRQHGDEECYASIFVFDIDLLANKVELASQNYFIPMINGLCSKYALINLNDPHYNEYYKIVEKLLYDFLLRTDFFELKIKKNLLNMILMMLEGKNLVINKDEMDYTNINTIKVVVDYVEANYNDDLTLETLSRVAGISVYRLSHMFKEITGKSCIDFVIDYRLSVIADLLKSTDEPITEIAVHNGFNNISNFNYAFRKKYKTTPSNYRKTRKHQL